jgi:thiamine biosynthesis lipoprotein
MGIDVGGIAKGYAADEAARILLDAGFEHVILDFGGNVLAVNTRPDGSPWRIGIQAPFDPRGTYVGIAEVTDIAVVTSGTYERAFVQDEVLYHHILDSETGYPVWNGLDSVTIVTASSTDADALSTAVFSMGLEEGYRFVEGLPGVEALFIGQDKTIYMTNGMDELFTVTNEAYRIGSL